MNGTTEARASLPTGPGPRRIPCLVQLTDLLSDSLTEDGLIRNIGCRRRIGPLDVPDLYFLVDGVRNGILG